MRRLLALALAGLGTAVGFAGGADDFTEFTLEELSQITLTSIARKQGSLFDTTAAAYVLSGDDVHRLGATDLASALRAVPGVQVGRIDPYNHAVSARGFNDSTSSKLLVLMDGRSLYNQTFSGAYWGYSDLFLADLERLEVVRGPGATLWGANAMNGVINIVSKSAFSTLGSLATGGTGDQLNSLVAVRHGWQPNSATAVRVYARYRDEDNYDIAIGPGAGGVQSLLAGARLDWKRPGGGGLTVIGEVRDQHIDSVTVLPTYTAPYARLVSETRVRNGGDLLVKWTQPLGADGELSFQASYERMESRDVTVGEQHDIFDTDLQLTLHPWERHQLLAGISARRDRDRLTSSEVIHYTRDRAASTVVGAFVQDEFWLVPETFSLTVGSKFERNSFTGLEVQPSVRAFWRPAANQTAWASISRAVRTPSRAERSIRWLVGTLPPGAAFPMPLALSANGSEQFDSERLLAFEVGHRVKLRPGLSFDTALFYNRYTEIRGITSTFIPFVPSPVPHGELAYSAVNNVEGRTFGGELLARWQPWETLLFEASASTLHYSLSEPIVPGMQQVTVPALEGSTPKNEFKLRTNWDFREDWTLDFLLRRTGRLNGQSIPAYTGLDVHLSWRPRHDLEFELVGHDLFDPSHPEAPMTFLGGGTNEIARSFFLRVTFRH